MNIFSTTADKLQANIYHVGSDSSQYLTNMNEHNFFIKPTNPIEIINTINNLNSNSANGPFSILNEILHLLKMNSRTTF